jgi:hypothetical protein
MKTFLTWTTALVLGLTTTSLVEAGGKGGSGSQGSAGSHTSQGSKQNFSPKNTSPLHSKTQNSFKIGTPQKKNFKNYHLQYGKKLGKNSYCYPGKYHNHWQYCCFNVRFGCYLYWCPCTDCWYYYCVPDCCYYPVWYVPYGIYLWGSPACYCTAPCPPEIVALPEPAEVVVPTE